MLQGIEAQSKVRGNWNGRCAKVRRTLRQECARSPTGDEPCGQKVDPRQVYEALAAVLKTAWRELSGV